MGLLYEAFAGHFCGNVLCFPLRHVAADLTRSSSVALSVHNLTYIAQVGQRKFYQFGTIFAVDERSQTPRPPVQVIHPQAAAFKAREVTKLSAAKIRVTATTCLMKLKSASNTAKSSPQKSTPPPAFKVTLRSPARCGLPAQFVSHLS